MATYWFRCWYMNKNVSTDDKIEIKAANLSAAWKKIAAQAMLRIPKTMNLTVIQYLVGE